MRLRLAKTITKNGMAGKSIEEEPLKFLECSCVPSTFNINNCDHAALRKIERKNC
jgi:hypothetical protein